jgi:hypothetical protein
MADQTFETLFSRQLRAYAEAGVRPVDRFAIAAETIAGGRTTPRWRRGLGLAPARGNRVLVPLLVGLALAALAGGALLVGSRLVDPRTVPHTYLDQLVSAPDLSMPMARPALVPLADGRVLVIGDDGDGGGTGTRALVYDPATGSSEPTGPLVSSESLGVESAVRLKDGTVLVVGNAGGSGGTAVAQVFDPSTLRFTPVGPMVTPRGGAAVALLPDGHVLFAGGTPSGQDAATSSAELFDPDTSTFSTTGSLGISHASAATAILPDGRVFVAPGEYRSNAEVYDPSTGAFSAGGVLRSGSGIPIALPDGRVVFIHSSLSGRGTVEVWNPSAITFEPVPADRLPGGVTSAILLDDGRILLVGGAPANWSGIYDPATGVTTPILPTRAWGPMATRLADGRVLVVGGLLDGKIRPSGGGTMAPGVSTVQIFQ